MTENKLVLKPCPFCGGAVEIVRKDKIGVLRCAEASPCMGSGLGNFFKLDQEAEAIAAWNTRALEATQSLADWKADELAAISDLSARTELSEMAVIRQALRLYQQHHSRIMAGETVNWSGDEQRAKDFAGPLYTTPPQEPPNPSSPRQGRHYGTG